MPGLIGFGWSLLRPFMIKAAAGRRHAAACGAGAGPGGGDGAVFQEARGGAARTAWRWTGR
ncbi:MAG: hypothetical protein WDN49_20430 [Acetobacteraceae bacterium]